MAANCTGAEEALSLTGDPVVLQDFLAHEVGVAENDMFSYVFQQG